MSEAKHIRASSADREPYAAALAEALAIGTASYGATQRWADSTAPRPVESAPPAASTPQATSTPSPGSVATTLFHMPMFTPQMFPCSSITPRVSESARSAAFVPSRIIRV